MRKYVNAKEILPQQLIEEIQKYIDGAHLYIPQKSRRSWGSTTGAREHLEKRNMEIQFLYRQNGMSIVELAERFGLSEERIRSILYDVTSRVNFGEGVEVEMLVSENNEVLLRPAFPEADDQVALRQHFLTLRAQSKPGTPAHEEMFDEPVGDEII